MSSNSLPTAMISTDFTLKLLVWFYLGNTYEIIEITMHQKYAVTHACMFFVRMRLLLLTLDTIDVFYSVYLIFNMKEWYLLSVKVLFQNSDFIFLSHFLSFFFILLFHFTKRNIISQSIDNSRTGLDTSKNQCSAPAVTALKNY